jgi:hypothetical protein
MIVLKMFLITLLGADIFCFVNYNVKMDLHELNVTRAVKFVAVEYTYF